MKRPGTRASVDVPLSALRLRGEHAAKPFAQVLATVDTGDERGAETLVIEFRHRDQAFARELARTLGRAPAAGSAV
jgi:hypothetical protein